MKEPITNAKINFLVEAYEQVGVSKDQSITIRLEQDQYNQLVKELDKELGDDAPRTTKVVDGKEVDIIPSTLGFVINGYSLTIIAKQE